MDDIFNEIDEELRADRARAMARRYGPAAVLGVLVLAGGIAGWQAWRRYEARQDRAAAQVYLTAMQDADGTAAGLAPGANPARAAAISGFEKVIASAPDGYRTLARLRAAALKADSGDVSGAVALYDAVAQDGQAETLLRDLASLMAVERQLDDGDPAKLRAALTPLSQPSNAWHALAQEDEALLDLRQGQTDQAKTRLKSLAADITAPAGVRGRANGLLARLGG